MRTGRRADLNERLRATLREMVERLPLVVGDDIDLLMGDLSIVTGELAGLKAERALALAEVRAHEAYFDSRGRSLSHWEQERKMILSDLSLRRRHEIMEKNEKITGLAEYLDAWSHSHQEYRDWLDSTKDQRRKLALAREQLAILSAAMEGKALERDVARLRVEVVRSKIGFARTEAQVHS